VASFPGVDYLDFDELLTEEQKLVRQTVRDFVDDKVMPIIEECAYEGRFPRELIPQLAELQLFGSSISEYGLPGLDSVAYGLTMQELERGDSGLRSFVSVQSGLVMYPIYTFVPRPEGPLDPRDTAGRAISCFGLAEPDFGRIPRACGRPTERKLIRLERRQSLDHERIDR
jgi:glutaryl-CoA dehydrogenase